MLLHGGLGAIDDFGGQIQALSAAHRVLAIDSRGHGRSSEGELQISYHRMGLDVIAVMNTLNIRSATIVGWSDGGIIGLDIGINFPDRIDGLFLIGAYYLASGGRPSIQNDNLMAAYFKRAEKQYMAISPTPDNFKEFSSKLLEMWRLEPNYSEAQLRALTMPTIVAQGAYEEAIDEGHARRMAELIPAAEFWLIENASHFAMWQQPDVVSAKILDFMADR